MAKRTRPYRGLFVKVYVDILNDPKIEGLDGETFKAWVKALAVAKSSQGVLPRASELAFKMRMGLPELKSRMGALLSAGLIDEEHIDGNPVWSIHQWDKWQTDSSSTERMRRLRLRRKTDVTQGDEAGDVTVTKSVTDVHYSYSTLPLVEGNACHEEKIQPSRVNRNIGAR